MAEKSPIENILSSGEIGDGHRSLQRAGMLLEDFKKSLGLPVAVDHGRDHEFKTFIAEVILGAAWYQKRYLGARRKVYFYIALNVIAVVGFPFLLIGLQKIAIYFQVTAPIGQVTSQVTAITTGVLGLQKTLGAWYSSQQRYATWYKSASDLKTIYYNLLQNWTNKAGANNLDFLTAIQGGIATARTIISNERLDYYQKLSLPVFDVLDLLTSGSSSVSSLVANLLPSTPPSTVSSVGKNSILSPPASETNQPGALQNSSVPVSAPASDPSAIVFSQHSLHRDLLDSPQQMAMVATQIQTIHDQRALVTPMLPPVAGVVEIALTTVSLNSNFDARISILFTGSEPRASVSLLVDSGNSVLIVPRWEDIAALPNSAQNYSVLGEANEPWGCPAKVVQGPIHLQTANGGIFTIQNCIFYACSADNAQGDRTANFGAACLSPWGASGWNVPPGLGITMQSPLSYAVGYPFAEFDYEAAGGMFGAFGVPNVSTRSILRLYTAEPAGYKMFTIIRGKAWMALTPLSLAIGNKMTGWPGNIVSPLAFIDTGGGPAYLSDPNSTLWNQNWPDHAKNPDWASSSVNCQSVFDPISIGLGDGTTSVTYTIDPSKFPASARGLTLVMCQDNYFMRGVKGMNVGGLSALANFILIDFQTGRVGFQPK